MTACLDTVMTFLRHLMKVRPQEAENLGAGGVMGQHMLVVRLRTVGTKSNICLWESGVVGRLRH